MYSLYTQTVFLTQEPFALASDLKTKIWALSDPLKKDPTY